MTTPQPQRPTRGPIFVIGSMGSGTTLLRLILDSHPNIAIAQETGFMRAVLAHKWIPFWKFGGEWYQRLGWTEDELDAELRRFYDTIFGRFAQEQGKQRWGDKSPYHVWHLEQAARVFPDAVFVATVRHPGGVTASVHNRFRYAIPRAMHHWVRVNLELAYRATQLGDRIALCRYEDMVLDPEATLREIVEWLGEPWSDDLLAHDKVHSRRGTPANVEGHTRSDQPISTAHLGKWKATLDDAARARLRARTAELGSFYGYDVDEPEPRPSWPGGDGPWRTIATGTDLAKRMAGFGDRIDFATRPGPTPENRLLKPALRQKLAQAGRDHASARARARASEGAEPDPEPAPPPIDKARAYASRVYGGLRRRVRRLVRSR